MQANEYGRIESAHIPALSIEITESSHFPVLAEFSYWAIRASLLQ
jgi:hypothetical protein